MDYAYWWWHWAMHMVPFFWRFHNVHHTDLDLDVSSGGAISLRRNDPFHRLSLVSRGALRYRSDHARSCSSPLLRQRHFFIIPTGACQFHVERILNLILVTPRMHGIHHSIVQRETNSNWGTMFCWWDKLHRTLRRDVPQDAITIGVAAYREENELTLGKLFALPFRAQREWRLPNGEIPEREPQPAEELAE